jgi:hypothetical protein
MVHRWQVDDCCDSEEEVRSMIVVAIGRQAVLLNAQVVLLRFQLRQ